MPVATQVPGRQVRNTAKDLPAEEEHAQVKQLAHECYEREGRPEGRAEIHWREAELMLRWKRWAQKALKPYLAHRAEEDSAGVAAELELVYPCEKNRPCAVVLVCLDGAPEYSRHWYDLWTRGINGRPLPEKLDDKDGGFYCLSSSALEYYHAQIVELAPDGAAERAARRVFQDACLAVFSREKPLHKAVVSAFRLKRAMSAYNVNRGMQWEEALWPRTAISTHWKAAAKCLSRACREDIVIGSTALQELKLKQDCQELLIAAGVKIVCDD